MSIKETILSAIASMSLQLVIFKGQNDLYRITGTGDAMHFVPIAGEVSAQ